MSINQNQHDWNINRIYKASKKDQLYLLEFKDDQIQAKSGWGYIKATLKHVFYAVTSWSGSKNRAEENRLIAHLFKQNATLLTPGKEIKNVILSSPPNTEKIERRMRTLGSHAEFVKRYGEVPVVDGKAIPTLDQLRGAFLLGSQLARYYDMSTNKTRAPYARAIQEIMVGEAVRDIPMPDDDLCFTCQELQEFDKFSPLKMPDGKRVVHNPMAWVIETTDKFMNDPTDEGRKQACDQFLDQFALDLMRIDRFVIGERKHDLTKENTNQVEERLEILREIKNDLLNQIYPESGFKAGFVETLQNYNSDLPRIFGYSEGVTADELCGKMENYCRQEFAKHENIPRDFTDRLVENFTFSADELAHLVPAYMQHFACSEEEAQNKLNTVLKFHMIKVALLTNQRSLAPDENSAYFPFNTKLNNIRLFPTENYGIWSIQPDAYEMTTVWQYNIPGAENIMLRANTGVKMTSLSVNAPCEEVQLQNVVVSPLAVDYLERIISA